MRTDEPKVAHEGIPFIAIPFGAALLAALLGWKTLALIALLFAISVALFFRNPKRIATQDKRFVMSPADGVVLAHDYVESDDDEPHIQGQKSKRLSIFLSVLDVHINRYPVDGTVAYSQHQPGKFLAAYDENASLDNEQQATRIIMDNEDVIEVVQIAGLIARRIVCYANSDEKIKAGTRMGLIRFGSRVDVWLPAHYEVLVQPGQRVRGGETLLAMIPGQTNGK